MTPNTQDTAVTTPSISSLPLPIPLASPSRFFSPLTLSLTVAPSITLSTTTTTCSGTPMAPHWHPMALSLSPCTHSYSKHRCIGVDSGVGVC
ncbi:hypothetical protein E2C01_078268 [Portunus trituberculatus]|uniref:Uncharacterized protein n=1 Tax=Portunus trituberculatus TaxID=210409 RepID=A0A5B7IPN0_PORTR|nr:hypothetical protein [Portunus trituberculatus]